jgi:[acyl-carrier-protein] S-malonyltransferase
MSKKVVLLFPGQGAQYVGMGEKLKGTDQEKFLKQADEALGFELSKIMLEGPEDQLMQTEYTQPAIFTYSVALLEQLKPILAEKGLEVHSVLGHSVGEYAALYAAGVISFEDGVRLVNQRGKFMQEAVPVGKGKMLAVLKVPQDVIEKGCEEISKTHGSVMPANYNEPGQIVISGEAAAIDEFPKWLEANHSDPHRTVELKVSAPFHSALMEPAAENMKSFIEGLDFKPAECPYIANIDATIYDKGTEPAIVKENLIKQIAGSVRWTQSIQKLPTDVTCLEVGPGRVLMGLQRKITREIPVISLDKDGSFDSVKEL